MFLPATVTAVHVDGRQNPYRVVAAGALDTEQEEPMTTAPPPMIRMVGVNKHFGSLHVLKDIDLEVDRGQVVVVLGPVKVRRHGKREAHQTAMALLERVGITDQADKYPAQLSGGQQPLRP